jgi:hypothetical protein
MARGECRREPTASADNRVRGSAGGAQPNSPSGKEPKGFDGGQCDKNYSGPDNPNATTKYGGYGLTAIYAILIQLAALLVIAGHRGRTPASQSGGSTGFPSAGAGGGSDLKDAGGLCTLAERSVHPPGQVSGLVAIPSLRQNTQKRRPSLSSTRK